MEGRFKELVKERRLVKKKIRELWKRELKRIIDEKKSDDEILDAMSKMIEGTDDVFEIQKMFVKMVENSENKYFKIKKLLAERLFDAAQGSFLNIEDEDLALAAKLFKEISNTKMAKRVENFHEFAYGIFEEINSRLDAIFSK